MIKRPQEYIDLQYGGVFDINTETLYGQSPHELIKDADKWEGTHIYAGNLVRAVAEQVVCMARSITLYRAHFDSNKILAVYFNYIQMKADMKWRILVNGDMHPMSYASGFDGDNVWTQNHEDWDGGYIYDDKKPYETIRSADPVIEQLTSTFIGYVMQNVRRKAG